MKKSVLITDHPNYGELLRLWIYSPVKSEWIQLESYGWRSVIFDVSDQGFLSLIYWLNVGAFFFPDGVDPNVDKPVQPIILFDDFLESKGVAQAFLDSDGVFDLDQATLRQFKQSSKIEALEKKVKQLQDVPKTPVDLAIQLLKQGYQKKSRFLPRILAEIEKKGYTIERLDEEIRITE